MRILTITPYYEPEGGGLERYAHAIAQRLAARGHTIQALAFTHDDTGQERKDGVLIERVAAPLTLGNTPMHLGFVKRVARIIQRYRPDVVMAHTPVPFPAQAAYLAARKAGVPFVTVYHAGQLRGSSPLLDLLASLDRVTFDRWMLEGSASVVAVGPYVRDNALGRHQARAHIVPPGVDKTLFSPCAGPTSNRVLFVGPLARAYAWKGVDVLWEAMRRVRDEVHGVELVLVGEGDRRLALEEKAKVERFPVHFAGRVSDHDLLSEYRRAAVVVLPSTSDAESFGMVLAEANACGRPVIASRIGGIPDYVQDNENGLLFDAGDAVDLSTKIARLLGNPGLANRLGRQGRAKVLRDHDWDRLTERTLRILQDAVAPNMGMHADAVAPMA